MRVEQIMTPKPACCSPEDTVERAAQLMEQNDCGCIPVIEAGNSRRLVGVITDRDIAVRGVAHGRKPSVQVSSLMTRTPFSVSADALLDDVEQVMSDRQVRRVVVVDDDHCCVGIVSQADIALAAERYADVDERDVARVVERISEPPQARL
ncbi:MAG: CBS domain-containing protein [Gemmatimonadaceae bacterium]